MAKTVPTTVALPALGEMAAGKPVLKSTWQTLIEAQHYVYGRQGTHVLNLVFDPRWESLDFGSGGNAYHAVGDTSGVASTQENAGYVQLAEHSGLFQFQRLQYNSAAADQGYMLAMNVYANNLDIRASVVRFDTEDGNTSSSTTVHTLTTSHASADCEWQLDTQEFTKAEASRGGSTSNGLAWFMVYVEAKVPASGKGYIYHLGIREQLITAGTNIPRGA